MVEPESPAGGESIVAKKESAARVEPYLANGREGLMGRYLMTPETSKLEFRLTIDGAYGWVFGVRNVARGLRRLGGGGKPVHQDTGGRGRPTVGQVERVK
jgi:hypothetical protein